MIRTGFQLWKGGGRAIGAGGGRSAPAVLGGTVDGLTMNNNG
ncbi:MAG: hypothetical protein AAGG75_23860 [Bacteroidota bacterium]